jgi:schlafen family protein
MTYPTDAQLKSWKNPSEDSFIERKPSSDPSDWVRTIVAFANSAPLDRCAVLYIGVRDDGTVQGLDKLDALQKTLEGKMKPVHPPVSYQTRSLAEEGREYLCVIVPGSENRPHFAGPAYVRVGSQTFAASAQQHESLLAERNSKTRRIRQFKGKTIHIDRIRTGDAVARLGRIASIATMEVVDCTAFSVTLKDQYAALHAIGLARVDIIDHPEWPYTLTLEISEG